MGKVLKIFAWGAAGLALAVAAGALGLKLYFSQARLKTLTRDYAAKNLGREVTFDTIALGLSGLSIANLRVSEYPDFKRGEFFSAAAFSVRPSFRALLRREIKINSISAAGLNMRVTELKKDTYNFSDLLAPAAPAREARPAPKEEAAPPLSISSLKVRNSRFSYTNAAGDMAITLREINLSASGISPAGLFPVEAAFTMAVASPYFKGEIPAAVKGKLSLGGFAPEKGRAEIEKASFALGGVKAEVKGSLANLLEPDAKLAQTVREFSTADLKPVFKNLPAKILLPEIEADTDFKLTAKNVSLRSVALRAGPVKASLKGWAAWNPQVSYDILADVKAQVPEIDTTLLARKAKQYPLPKGLKLPLAEVSARLSLKNGNAAIPSFSLESSPLAVKGRLTADFSGPLLKAAGTANAEVKSLAGL
ncbi:MAG: AsmA family protein, partial [Elusimicrobiota bacterium]|nr:AsmA family protein [Elusimicrobiota bacterium]